MAAIGLLSDSEGDLEALDAAYELLRAKGARRFIFPGGCFTDVEEWIAQKRLKVRGEGSYSDADFLADVSNFLSSAEQVERPPAFTDEPEPPPADEDLDRLLEKFVRTPEKGSLRYLDPATRKSVDLLGETLCCVVHDKNDLTKDDLLNAVVFLHGKGEEPKVVQIGPRFFVTPGKLAGRGTCALIRPVERSLEVSGYDLDGALRLEPQLLAVAGKKKVSVK